MSCAACMYMRSRRVVIWGACACSRHGGEQRGQGRRGRWHEQGQALRCLRQMGCLPVRRPPPFRLCACLASHGRPRPHPLSPRPGPGPRPHPLPSPRPRLPSPCLASPHLTSQVGLPSHHPGVRNSAPRVRSPVQRHQGRRGRAAGCWAVEAPAVAPVLRQGGAHVHVRHLLCRFPSETGRTHSPPSPSIFGSGAAAARAPLRHPYHAGALPPLPRFSCLLPVVAGAAVAAAAAAATAACCHHCRPCSCRRRSSRWGRP